MSVTTRILSIAPDDPDVEALAEAAAVLRAGGLVAFATETVYGLGADATRPDAVARIFAAKGRPPSNPMIVHADGIELARACVAEWPEAAGALAEAFWPGPLTLVLPRSGLIPDAVTAGRETVAVRVPAPLVARRLIESLGRPIAAPSANRSAGVSPTLACHVLADLGGRIELILDSGQTAIGLESTVLDLTTREPRILRPGPISAQELEHVLGGLRVRRADGDSAAPDAPLSSPGQLPVHYAPRTPADWIDDPDALADYDWPGRAALVVVGPHLDLPDVPESVPRFDLPSPDLAARDLYVTLRECDALGLERIVVVPPPDLTEWHAVRDRLRRACRSPGR